MNETIKVQLMNKSMNAGKLKGANGYIIACMQNSSFDKRLRKCHCVMYWIILVKAILALIVVFDALS